jgi:hypothetical protein
MMTQLEALLTGSIDEDQLVAICETIKYTKYTKHLVLPHDDQERNRRESSLADGRLMWRKKSPFRSGF